MSLTVIHAAVTQLLNGLLLMWPLAFPLSRCSDDATETEITHYVKGHQAAVQIKSIGNTLNSSGRVKHPWSCGTFYLVEHADEAFLVVLGLVFLN